MDNWKKQKVQLRRGTAAEWASRNTLLLQGEPGYETDTGRLKLGDGLTRWNSLAYWGAAEVTSGDYGQVIVNADGTWSVDITPADIGASAVGHTHSASEIVSGTLSDSRLSGNVVLTADARLSDAREWSAGTITQAEAEAGVSTARQAFTALRVFQAIAAWWAGSAAKTKLDGIAAGATANSTDAQLRDRSTHTGVQAISTVTGLQTALDGKQAAGTYATLVNGLIPSAQLPSYVDDVLEYADSAAFPATGESGKIYIAIGTNKTYRWGGTTYVEIASSPGSTDAVPEGAVNLYFTSVRASAAAPVQSVAGRTGAVTLAKADVGLGNVDNTSDANKPISTAAQAALDLKSPLASPSFTGQVAIPAGSAALPPLTFSGDPDTGIYRPDPNAFSIATGGAERMRVAGSYITAYSPAGVERWSFDINNGTQEIKGAIRGTLSLNSAYTTGSTDIGVVRFMNNAGVALGRMDVSGGPDTTSTGLFRFQVRNDTQVNTTAFTISHVAVTSTVPISCDPGTAEAPAITFTGDTDTGIWLPANNTVAIATGGVRRMSVEPDGRVWIGETPLAGNGHLGLVAGTSLTVAPLSKKNVASGGVVGSETTLYRHQRLINVASIRPNAFTGILALQVPLATGHGMTVSILGSGYGSGDTPTWRVDYTFYPYAGYSGRGESLVVAGQPPFLKVRLMKDATNTDRLFLFLGDETTAWAMSQVSVDVTCLHSASAMNATLFDWVPLTSETGYSLYHSFNDLTIQNTFPAIGGVKAGFGAGTVSAPDLSFTGDTDTGLWSPAGNTIAVSTAGVERLRVEADGNVRIGAEATAAAMLEVQASNAEVYPVVSSGLNGAARASVLTRNSSATTGSFASYGFLVTRGDGSQQIASIGAVSNEDAAYAPHLVFTVRSASGNNTERLRITATGDIGIGTNAPSALLDVNSNTVRVRSSRTPASASATGNAGDICWDSSYIYVCTATNTWRRIAHSTW